MDEKAIKVGIIPSGIDQYVVWGEDGDYLIFRVIAWEYQIFNTRENELDTYMIPICDGISSPWLESDCSDQIQFIGTKKECEEKLTILKNGDKKN